MSDEKDNRTTAFEDAGKEEQAGLVREFWDMLMENKKYWMLPILIVLLGFGALIVLGGGSTVAPFIYTLF